MALARWRQLPRFVDTEIVNLREGLKRGLTAPPSTVRQVIVQVDGLRAPSRRLAPLEPAGRDGDAAFGAALGRIVAEEVAPRPRPLPRVPGARVPSRGARDDAVSATFPPGPRAMRARCARTPLSTSPRRRSTTSAGASSSASKTRCGRSRAVLRHVGPARADAEAPDRSPLHVPSKEEVIAHAAAALERAKAAMPRWFGRLPRSDVVIRPQPAFREPTTEQYNGPARGRLAARGLPDQHLGAREEEPGRDGVDRLPRDDPGPPSPERDRPRARRPASRPALHPLRLRVAQQRGLRRGVGPLLGAPRGRDGALLRGPRPPGHAHRARPSAPARLVVDPGLHVLGWSRAQAIEYMLAHTSSAPDEVESEVDRYISWPGQAVGYMVGALEIQRLRAETERRLGAPLRHPRASTTGSSRTAPSP